MSLKDFFTKKRAAINGVLAASAIFVGGLSSAEAAEKLPPQNRLVKKNTLQSNRQKIFSKIDRICINFAQKNLIKREGNKNHLYLDSKGILHTGIGLNINNYKSFSELDFVGENGALLNERQKRAYFAKVKAFQRKQALKGFNYKASYYAKHLKIYPTKASLDKMFAKRIADSMDTIKNTLGQRAYYNLHAIAQAEIIMMHYNMGSERFNPSKWPKFFEAARHADYLKMSQECHTKSISEERNRQIAHSFTSLLKAKWYAFGTIYSQQDTQIVKGYQEKRII